MDIREYENVMIQPSIPISGASVFHAIGDIDRHQFFILAFHGHSAISNTIRWVTKSDVSHVGMYLDGILYEAWHRGGVVRNPIDTIPHRDKTPFSIYAVNLKFDIKILRNSLHSYLGMGYDFNNVFRYALNRVPSLNDSMFCSDYQAVVFNDCGYDLWNDRSKRISPDEAIMFKPVFIECGRGVFYDDRPNEWVIEL